MNRSRYTKPVAFTLAAGLLLAASPSFAGGRIAGPLGALGPIRVQAASPGCNVSGEAFGAQETGGAAVTTSKVADIVLPPGGTNSSGGISTPLIVTTGAITDTSIDVSTGVQATAVSTSTVDSLNLLAGAITSGPISSVSSSTSNGGGASSSSVGTTFTNLTVAGAGVFPSNVAANTRVDVLGVGYAILNEQTPGNNNSVTTAGLTVIAVHLFVMTATVSLPVGTQIIVASATSGVDCTAAAAATQTANAAATQTAAAQTANAGATQTAAAAQTANAGASQTAAAQTANAGATQTAAAAQTANAGATQTAAAAQTANAGATQTAAAGAQTANAGATQTAAAAQTANAGGGGATNVGATQTAAAGTTQTANAGATQTAAAAQTANTGATQTAAAGAIQTANAGATQTAAAQTANTGGGAATNVGATQTAAAGATQTATAARTAAAATSTSSQPGVTAIPNSPEPTATPQGGASIVVDPSSSQPGAVVQVRGRGFGPGEQITLSLNGAAIPGTPTITTGRDGSFVASFVVPNSLLNGANALSANSNRTRRTALVGLNGHLPVSARFYFTGVPNTRTDHAALAVLNPQGQRARARITLYSGDGTTVSRAIDIAAHTQRTIALAGLLRGAGVFGLTLTANRQIAAQITINRNGKDGDGILGAPGLATTWYLAEGYTGLTFHETVSILNTDARKAARVRLHLLPFGGRRGRDVLLSVPAHTNSVVDVNRLLPGLSLSAIARSDRPIVVERTLTFSNGGYGLTTRAGANAAATSWLFAEGTTVNRFETFLTILNPNPAPALVTARFFSRTGRSLGSKTIRMAGNTRANIKLNDVLSASGVASVVTSNRPIVVERPEYFGSPNAAHIAGSVVFGRNGGAPRWSFAGGQSGSANSEFLLLYNPLSTSVPVELTFYGDNGSVKTRRITVAPNARYTFDVNRIMPRIASSHGIVARARGGQGIVVERTIFAPNHSTLRSTQGLAQ